MLGYVWWVGWWWWWILIVLFFWLIFIPPFGYGRRWYTTRYGRVSVPVPPQDLPYTLEWQAIEARFVDSPADALAQADHVVAMRFQEQNVPMDSQDYQRAHETMLRGQRGAATTDEMRQAMVLYRSLYEHLA